MPQALVLIKDLGMLFPTETSKQKKRYGMYLCECGVEFKAATYKVKINHTQSCGCYGKAQRAKSLTTHGLSLHPLYLIWADIKTRCNNINRFTYDRYGKKGVTMYKAWEDDFQVFYDWCMANGYEKGLQLDKDYLCELNGIDPKIYSPSTCLFMSAVENNPHNMKRKLEKEKGVSYDT